MQFNWIFVILVGMALLGILFMQSQQATQRARYEANLQLRESLQGMLASSSPNNHKEIKLGAVSVLNDCDDDAANLYVGKGRLPIETSYYALHAPKRINSRNLHLQSVDGITFLTGEDHVYLFVDYGYDKLLELYNLFEGKKQLVDRAQATSFPPEDSSFKYTMIFYLPDFDPNNNLEYNSVDYSFDIVVISPSTDDGRSVVYFRTNKNFVESEAEDYLNDGELLGAIVDSDYGLYSCLHKKQLRKEYLRLELLKEKKDLMIRGVSDSCESLLNHLNNPLNNALSAINDFDELSLKQSILAIDRINNDLARNNCPIIK